MKDSPALPGGLSKSKPTWRGTAQNVPRYVGFFHFGGRGRSPAVGRMPIGLALLGPDEEHVALLVNSA